MTLITLHYNNSNSSWTKKAYKYKIGSSRINLSQFLFKMKNKNFI